MHTPHVSLPMKQQRRGLAGAALVVLAGCGNSTVDSEAVWRLTSAPQENTLEVRAEYSGCADFKEWKVEESNSEVEVRAVVKYPKEVSCDADQVFERHSILLADPLGTRRLTGCDPYDPATDCHEVAVNPEVG